ncbi:cell division protein FtsX [Roseibium algae]|uniref:ABC transporter permease n=1 Tax=Roseibium algae TaxID=3123038 RepID=A0ABU8TLV7_9HYPH
MVKDVKKAIARSKTASRIKGLRMPAKPTVPRRSNGKKPSQTQAAVKLRSAAPIVPPQSVAGRALTLVVAIMSFLACLTIGGVSIVWDAADDWQNDLVREVTIQIRPADGIDMLREIDKAVALAQEFPGVETVRALSDDETRALLQPWLGDNLDLDSLPVPRLIQITVDDPEALDLAQLRSSLERQVAGASLDDHSVWTSRLSAMAGAVVFGGVCIMLLVLGSMVLSVVFATQSAMAGNKDVVSVLHFVGAEDSFIAREFQRHFLVLGLKGGISGGVFASMLFLILDLFTRRGGGQAGSDQLSALFGTVSVSLPGYLGVIGVVFLVAVLTALTSGLAVKAHLKRVD